MDTNIMAFEGHKLRTVEKNGEIRKAEKIDLYEILIQHLEIILNCQNDFKLDRSGFFY